jgi:hypothetical protein
MPRVLWPLRHGRPSVEIVLSHALGRQRLTRILLADTGAGTQASGFELVLDEDDCLLCGGVPGFSATLRGAYAGSFPVYDLSVEVPQLGFVSDFRVVGVPLLPPGFDRIACFGFLNRFHNGNFGDPVRFGLEV